MNWHYAEGSEARGPVTDAELEALISAGKVAPGTLVWHEGMAAWLPCAQVKGTSGAAAAPSVPSGRRPARPGLLRRMRTAFSARGSHPPR